jgi:type I restriction enzyme M protein
VAREYTRGQIALINPHTCGVYKDGGLRYRVDPATGRRLSEIDDELNDHVEDFLAGGNPPGSATIDVNEAFRRRVLVPRYFDERYIEPYRELLRTHRLESVSLGQLLDDRIIGLRGGHGSPSNDARRGTVPYIKVSDIRALRVNVNPTNLVSRALAEKLWRGSSSGLRAWDLISPNRASSNIGEFAILLPGEESVVLTKEMFVFRVSQSVGTGWDPFYLHWALCLKAVRNQWRRITLMQTNREDVGDRYREIEIPVPRSPEWAKEISAPFRSYFQSLAAARTDFLRRLDTSGFDFIPSAHSVGGAEVVEEAVVAEADIEQNGADDADSGTT